MDTATDFGWNMTHVLLGEGLFWKSVIPDPNREMIVRKRNIELQVLEDCDLFTISGLSMWEQNAIHILVVTNLCPKVALGTIRKKGYCDDPGKIGVRFYEIGDSSTKWHRHL